MCKLLQERKSNKITKAISLQRSISMAHNGRGISLCRYFICLSFVVCNDANKMYVEVMLIKQQSGWESWSNLSDGCGGYYGLWVVLVVCVDGSYSDVSEAKWQIKRGFHFTNWLDDFTKFKVSIIWIQFVLDAWWIQFSLTSLTWMHGCIQNFESRFK